MENLLYFGGVIRTMEGDETAQALLVQEGKIAFVGPLDAARRMGEAREIDLAGRALLPAFIDSHSHLAGSASARLQLSLAEATTPEDMGEMVRAYIEENRLAPGEWVMARGYVGSHPSMEIFDRAAPDHPVVAQHASGHMGVFNRRALDSLGETGDGYREEGEFLRLLTQAPQPSAARLADALALAQEDYAAHGITVAQEGMVVPQMAALYQVAGPLLLDVIGYADVRAADQVLEAFPSNLRFGGYKMVLDGSPQGGTAWMRGEDGSHAQLTDAQAMEFARRAARENRQLLAHCNGDAACDQFIHIAEQVGDLWRPVAIHAQLMQRESLSRVKALGMVPSFFVAHVYHWGDAHIQRFGLERASAISPLRSALALGIPFTLHQDSPVIPPDMLETLWCAVNRRTRAGVALGLEEAVSPLDALRAVTLNAAHQYGLEGELGSLRPGKRADLVILGQDPVAAAPMDIRNIPVLETWKAGKRIFSAQG